MADAGARLSSGAPLPLQWPLVGRHDELDLFAATLGDDRAHGFVIHGPAGVGKTRLADQCLAVADGAGRSVARATATEGSRSAPLGALAHLLPPGIADERCDLVTLVSEVRPVLLEQAANGPLVLFVDDLHLLDATSATLVGQLVDADLVFLVATVRADAELSPGLGSLWQRARVRRIDLGDLDRASVDTLLHLVLHGPVEASTVAELWTASKGNVLYVRELVLGAIDSGRLVEQHGVWRLVGPLVTTPRLQELVATRLADLDASATEVLDLLAVWEPVGLAALEGLVSIDVLEGLDRAGVIVVRGDGRRQQVRLAHPLHGEILRDRMPPLTRRRLLLEQADRIDAWGGQRREDAVRAATARLDASGSADHELLVRAARLARYGQDYIQVERLARAAVVDEMTGEAGLLLGEALHELGAFVEADEVLTAAEAVATDEQLLVYIAEIRSRNLMWGLFRHGEALEVNRVARDALRDPAGVDELTLNEALLLTYAGRPLEALALLSALEPGADSRARALRAHAEVPALAAVGRCVSAADAAGRAFAEQRALPDQIAIADPGAHILQQIYALTEAGRLDEALTLASAAYEATPPTATPDIWMWLSHQMGRIHLIRGQLGSALRCLGEALARCEENGLDGPSRLVLSALATAHAGLGDAAAAGTASDRIEQLVPFPFVESEQEFGRAWARAASGDLAGARQILLDAADLAAGRGYRTGEAWLLHDVARLGDPSAVRDRLHNVAAECEGELAAAYASHAAAAAGGDAEALVQVTDQFERLGALLLAAESASEAAQALQRAGDGRASAALGQRAATLLARCEGARTPALSAPIMVAPLTPRERDIAALAAQGESSKAIAARLVLSVRTVNNHLQNVYAKLGVTGRGQLAAALGDADDVSDPVGVQRAQHHRLRREVVGEGPRLLDVGRPPRLERGPQGAQEGLAHQPVVGGVHPEALVRRAQRSDPRFEPIEGADRAHDLVQLGREPGALRERVGGEHPRQGRFGRERPVVERGGDGVEVNLGEALLDEGDLVGGHSDISPQPDGCDLSNRCSTGHEVGTGEQSVLRTFAARGLKVAPMAASGLAPRTNGPAMLTVTNALASLAPRPAAAAPRGADSRLTSSVAVITGGGRGIGRLLATSFADAGASVGLLARSGDQLSEVVEAVEAAGGTARAAVADVTNPDALHSAISSLEHQLGPIDLLVNNAGIVGPIGPLWEIDSQDWWSTFDVNVRGLLLATQHVLPSMVARRRGRIINLTSQAGVYRWPLVSGYSVSKAAVTKLTENLAHETSRYGVSVFSVHPGLLPIGMSETVAAMQPSTPYEDHIRTWALDALRHGRGAEPERAAELVVRIAAGDADALSGRHLSVHDDLDELLERIAEVRARDLYVLRPDPLSDTTPWRLS